MIGAGKEIAVWKLGSAICAALFVLACGDGGDGGDAVDPALEQALASMTDSQLAAMPLTAQAELVDKMKGLEGQPVGCECEFSVDEVETFAVDGLTGEATGLRLRPRSEARTPAPGEAPSTSAQTTAVIFTYGPLLITVAQLRCYETDIASQVEKAAQAQVERIEGVLKGEIVDTPAPTPPPETPGLTEFPPLTPGTEVGFAAPDQSGTEGELLFTGLRIEAVDFDLERIDFALIGPYSGPLPRDVKIVDDLEGVCKAFASSSTGATEFNLLAGEELVFTDGVRV